MKKIKLKIAVVSVILLATSMGINTVQSTENLVIEEKAPQSFLAPNDIVELDGSIIINENKIHLIYPTIEMPKKQTHVIDAIKVGDYYFIDATLRIKVDTHLLDPRYEYRLGRYLKTVITITRPLRSLSEKIVGKLINFNRTNVISDNGVYVDIPFKFRLTEQKEPFTNEPIRIRIVAMGSAFGLFSEKRLARGVIDVTCRYVELPVTICHLMGYEIDPYEP